MASKLATVGIVAMALTILMASATPSWSPIYHPQLLLLY
jgi:hypothetical protein